VDLAPQQAPTTATLRSGFRRTRVTFPDAMARYKVLDDIRPALLN
jgi:hypothetical protein